MRIVFSLIFSFLFILVNAQQSTFKWHDELCEYEGVYDSTNITKDEISGCLLLAQDHYRFRHSGTVFHLEDIQKLNIDSLEMNYRELVRDIDALTLPNLKVWQEIKASKLREINQLYTAYKSIYKAFLYNDYAALLSLNGTDSCMHYYSNALVKGGDSLLVAWQTLIDIQVTQNGYSEKFKAKYRQRLASAERLQYAKMEVLNFGWWNCANKHNQYLDQDLAIKEFDRLFISTHTIICDEP